MKQPTHLFLKPKHPGACIRDPRSRTRLPAYGAKVPNNRYWRARFADGDCVKTKAEEIAKGKAAEADKVKAAAEADAPAKDAEATTPKSAKRGR